MKLALPLLLLSTIVILAFGKRDDDDRSGADLNDWVKTEDIDDDVVDEFNEDIDDCVRETHTHNMFYHCINDHLHYYNSNELSSEQKSDIRRGADRSNVHGHGGGSRKLRGI
jgi:hypothetical protein